MKQKPFFAVILAYILVFQSITFSSIAFAQTTVPAKELYSAPKADIDKIMDEGMNRSQVVNHIEYLTDVIGPRLTNSPGMRKAADWSRNMLAKWGLNSRLEPFGPWGRGWSLQSFQATVVEPTKQWVLAYPNAWSPSTNGPITAEVVFLDAPTSEDLKKYEGKLKGKIVLISEPRTLKEDFPGIADRFDDDELAKLVKAGEAAPRPTPAAQPDLTDPRFEAFAKRMQKILQTNSMIAKEKPAVVIESSPLGSQGAMMVHSATLYAPADQEAMKILGTDARPWLKKAEPYLFPQLTMANEDYNRLVRLIKQGITPRMTVDIKASYHDEDVMAHNVIAEIPGTDPKLKDEIVMLGAHLDSWHASKGATDNAAGSGVVMEAVRILMAAGLRPRRTIRVALWSGEEQGLLGSKAYVEKHFGSMSKPTKEAPKPVLIPGPEYEKLSAYFNLDNGSGKIRGVYLMGNTAVKPIFEEWLKPFGEVGAKTLTLVSRGSTDHVSFDQIGLPGFGFIQDPLNYSLEYGPRSHHTNLDNFDRIIPEDVKQASIVMAAFVYQTAMMDGKIPKKKLN